MYRYLTNCIVIAQNLYMPKNNNLVPISDAAKYLGITVMTLRRWDESGKLRALRSAGGHRYYHRDALERYNTELFRVAQVWAASEVAPDLPSGDYSDTQDRFRARLDRMANLINQNPQDSEAAALVTAVAGEIGNNAFDHNLGNWPDTPGLFFSYDLNKRIIVLADRGVGIKATLLRVRPEMKDDTEALTVAMTEFVSGRAPEQRGNGLKFVRTVGMQNPIGIALQSGVAIATIEKEDPKALKVRLADHLIRGTLARIEF
jgi:excisionase family DNA binding protein